ncbi:MAG: peptidoglycan-binding protein [Pedobacter sp.]|nr:MAG: peptidoglycan-binding protein [Pedobacter sp.]
MLATKTVNGLHLSDKEFATRLIQLAEAELWVREKTGHNDGKRVEEYLATVGLKKGNPYCAAFVSFIFKQAGYQLPRTGWSPSLFPTSRLVKAAAPGNVFGIFFPGIKRIGHCGFVTGIHNDWVNTIEANTNAAGSREGDGVFRRLRHKRALAALADWLRVGTEKKGRKP